MLEIKNMIRKIRIMIIQNLYTITLRQKYVSSSPALIVAPHPDDETFGCSGLIAEKVRKSSKVYILFLTAGEKSLHTVAKEQIQHERRQSAILAMQALGLNEKHLLWLDLSDGGIPRKHDEEFGVVVDEIVKVIERTGAKEVYAPHYFEGWSDHIAAHEITVEAVKNFGNKVDFYLYWVWTWYYLSVVNMFKLPKSKMFKLPIRSVYDKKHLAIEAYTSNKTQNGEPYMGHLPKIFMKSFSWPYEVYEKVENK